MFSGIRMGALLLFSAAAVVTACGDSSPSQPSVPTYSISGSVIGVGGASIRVSDSTTARTAITDANGTFLITGLKAGTYSVAPTQAGFSFEPMQSAVTIRDADAVSPPFARKQPDEGLSPQDAARIDAQTESPVSLDAVILPNGQTLSAYAKSRGITPPSAIEIPSTSAGPNVIHLFNSVVPDAGPQQKKNDVIAQMVMSAHDYACGRDPVPCTKWNFPPDPTGTVMRPKPAQNGLTYIWGGKNPAVRTLPADGCPELTFGMDCSGLISRIAASAGLSAPAGSSNQSDPNKWLIPADWKLKFKRVTDGSFQTGDLVAWNGHIGIAARDGRADVPVLSSTGLPGDCKKNIERPRGPRSLTVTQLGLGAPVATLRLVTTLSGDWDVFIRCSNQSSDAAKIRFTINNDDGGPFTATGTGTDYNGAPLSFVLEGTYNQNSNTVSATLSFTDGTRRDKFTVVLLEDDTGYFPLTKLVDNGGCLVSARLVRVQTPAVRNLVPQPGLPSRTVSPTSLLGRYEIR